MTETYNWADNPTMSGTPCDTDKLNECLMHLKYNNKKGDGLPLFTALAFDHILTGDEAIGWVLQGATVTRTYPDAVDRIISEYDNGFDETVTVSDVTFTFRKALNGRKIADVLYKDQIDELYAKTGVADYYIVDKEQQHFQLPRNKKFIQFTADTNQVNDYIEAGLPNITGTIINNAVYGGSYSYTSGAMQVSGITRSEGGAGTTNSPNVRYANTLFDASLSNSLYGKSETVQPPVSLKLLYYKVGDTVSNESMIDVGNVLSEIDLKANKDFSNTTPNQNFKDTVIGWGIPDFSKGVTKVPTIVNQADNHGWLKLDILSQLGTKPKFSYSLNAEMNNSIVVSSLFWDGAANTVSSTFLIPCPQGIYYKQTEYTARLTATFYPMKGQNND